MKFRNLVVMAASAALLCAVAWAAEDVNLDGVKCIVNTKGAAKATSSVDYRGGKVYFCCDNCPKKFAADKEKYSTAANAQLVATKQAKQEKCPISGEPCKPEQKVSVGGTDVYFCCPNCKGKVAKAKGAEQAEMVFSNKAFEKAFKVTKK